MSDERNKREPDREEDPNLEEGEFVEEAVDEPGGSPQDPSSEEMREAETEAEAFEEDVEAFPAEEAAELERELESVRRERDEYLDSLRRLKAEFENSRKRQEKEKERIYQTASERLILSLLPVLDNLDRALEYEGDVREGVQATRNQLADAMSEEGLLPIASDGQNFDPNVHEAVMSQPSDDHEEGMVLQTFERGYLLNGKPIRPAKVVVSQ
ncbi:MAG: nucleotide exchange factor GrpE [Actinomycetota bacterium]|nr:nucleotide exchange factor GrpE [Rubrobacter sp.]MDQ3506734.1 nucleotide exchange factor GrpE [Actinomycetota bacterium]